MRLVSYLIMSLTTELCLTSKELERVIEESGLMDAQTDEYYQELIDQGIESLESDLRQEQLDFSQGEEEVSFMEMEE